MSEDRRMDDAERARLLARVDDMFELVEADIRDDLAAWTRRVDTLADREDGSLEAVVRLLSQWAALTTIALAGQTGTPMDRALSDARLTLMQWIEEVP